MRRRPLVFAGDRLLVAEDGDAPRLPADAEVQKALFDVLPGSEELQPTPLDLAPVQGLNLVVYDLPEETTAPEGYGFRPLRSLSSALSLELFRAIGTASQKLHWVRTHRFCSRCGHLTRRHDRHQAMECHECGHLHFPRIAPAVIVLIVRDHEMLLARSPHFPEGMYSTLAGFVEPGETLEETLHREVREEVGVEVDSLKYFGSQPWPFPHSLMVGFMARWAGGEIDIDEEEIEDAGWFSASNLPPRLPGHVSIARRLVEAFLQESGAP